MYTFGYRNPRQAKTALLCEQRSDFDCRRCPACRIICPMEFDVSAKIQDIAHILQVPVISKPNEQAGKGPWQGRLWQFGDINSGRNSLR
jgi:hypothetical protein